MAPSGPPVSSARDLGRWVRSLGAWTIDAADEPEAPGAASVTPPSLSPTALAAIVDHTERQRASGGAPGVSLVLTDRSSTLVVICLGASNIDRRSPVTPDHLFQIGSVSKVFAAIVTLQLVDEGMLDLLAPVQTYLPWFEVRTEHEPISMHHLLSHTAGLIDGSLGHVDARAEAWALRDTETAWPPGTAFHYSNAGYDVVGLVVAAITGRSFRDVLEERVLRPLGMFSSSPAITADIRPRFATPYTPFFTDRPFRPGHRLGPATWFEDDRADGSICSTPHDMATFVRMLLGHGAGSDGRRVLSERGFQRLTDPPIRDESGGYGYGIAVEEAGTGLRLGHGGDMVGFEAHLLADVGRGVGAVVLANGPLDRASVTRYAVEVMAADRLGSTAPPVPLLHDRFTVGDRERYLGVFRRDDERLTVVTDDTGLAVEHGRSRTRLEPIGAVPDTFFAGHPRLDRALLEFQVVDDRAVAVFHGRQRYLTDDAPPIAGPSASLRRFEGLYRTTSPWRPAVRFSARGRRLVMIDPLDGVPQVLERVGDDAFRVPGRPPPPGEITFSRTIDGVASCVSIEALQHHRSFDPPSPWNDEDR